MPSHSIASPILFFISAISGRSVEIKPCAIVTRLDIFSAVASTLFPRPPTLVPALLATVFIFFRALPTAISCLDTGPNLSSSSFTLSTKPSKFTVSTFSRASPNFLKLVLIDPNEPADFSVLIEAARFWSLEPALETPCRFFNAVDRLLRFLIATLKLPTFFSFSRR